MKNDPFVIIPAHNEQTRIAPVLRKVNRFCNNIIVVDDGSSDLTAETAEKEGVLVLRHAINLGKGAALKTGAEYALRKGARRLVFIDADGQHMPEDIPRFLEALNGVDIVFGSRALNKKMPAILKFGNWVINTVNNLLFRIKLSDTQSGYRAMTASAYRSIRWNSTSYSVESEMIANAGRKRLKYREIKIRTIYSDKYKGTTVIDGIKIVLNMLWWKISRWH
ncbi:glycosyltransferase family 2 protein [Candidatus Woesearchaeota archaeon]|nr:glycosyltransferase family 2 protein [Candidatus Woesearchaeota archaeon]